MTEISPVGHERRTVGLNITREHSIAAYCGSPKWAKDSIHHRIPCDAQSIPRVTRHDVPARPHAFMSEMTRAISIAADSALSYAPRAFVMSIPVGIRPIEEQS